MQLYARECMYRHANGVVSRFALEGLAFGSTAGGREYFACGKGLNDDSESRRPDIFKLYGRSRKVGHEWSRLLRRLECLGALFLDAESRRPDWQKARQMAGFRASWSLPQSSSDA
jgi:hypothetical protein